MKRIYNEPNFHAIYNQNTKTIRDEACRIIKITGRLRDKFSIVREPNSR